MLGLLPLLLPSLPLLPSFPEGEAAAIERAVLDYAEAYYEVRPDYVERGIHPDLVKMGYFIDPAGAVTTRAMEYQGFLDMVMWFVDSEKVPDAGPKEVVILDAMDQTAICQLTGSWGVDYMQLAKFDGRWQTRHVVWQGAPPERSEEEIAEDHAAIEAAVLDYVEGIYEVQPERLERSLDPNLAKYGFWSESPDQPYRGTAMTYAQLIDLAGNWNADGKSAGPDAPKRVEVLGQMDLTACAKLTAAWGIDYMHLAKVDGRWRITQVLWQSVHAEEKDRQRG